MSFSDARLRANVAEEAKDKQIAAMASIIDAMSEALELADRLIEINIRADTPKEWHAAYRKVARERAKLKQ